MTKRADWGRFIVGSRGDDDLKGTAGRDVIVGRNGADVLEGRAGNDLLIGDDAHGGWHHCFWWRPKGSLDDYLDGGAGSDLVLAGRGNDVANYTLSENSRAHDVYDGGKGFDTLQLTVTHAELQLATVQQDIAAFRAFLARTANQNSDHGKTFDFKSFDLDVRNFEALEIRVIGGNTNTAPAAKNDGYGLEEDGVLLVPGPGLAGNDADAEGSPLSVALVAGPAHGTLVLGADGSFNYTPSANFNGSDSFTYKVNDGELDSNVATVALQVAPVNDAPVAAGEAIATDEDTPFKGNVLANDADADGDALTAELVDGPVHGTLALNPDGTFNYNPDANFSGTDGFTYRASDGSRASGVVQVDLTVAPINDAPVTTGEALATHEDGALTGNVLANDADPDGDTLTAELVDGPVHGTLALNPDGTFTYNPEANFSGTDGFTYRASDGRIASGATTVDLTVTPVNDAPIATGEALATDEDTPLTGSVLANDSDTDGDALIAELVDGPVHGTLALNPDGTFTYNPEANFSGADSFTYRASDGNLASGVTSVDLAVAPVNDTPVAADDDMPTDEDLPVSGFVMDNDTDADGDALTATLLSGPSHGNLEFAADGTYTYTPAAEFSGIDSFTYQVSDGQSGSSAATVTLAVAPVNDAPVAGDDAIAEHAITPGPIRVAVIGGNQSSYVAAAAQLEDSTAFSIDADAISAKAFSTQDQWTALLDNYDVVVLGDSGFATDYGAPSLFPALHTFVDGGGGVVTAGWFAYVLPTLSKDADYITPIGPQTYKYAAKNSMVTVVDSSHPITEGIANYKVNAAAHELAGGVDAGATVLARGVSGSASLPALVVDEVGQGRTAYFGSLQMASASTYSPDRVPGGTVDQIFERAVAWAAGSRDVNAATDEDTPLAIDPAALLANDRDIENDALAISAVSPTSALGAAVSIGAGGSILYDPTAALQHLKPGEVVTDSFDYTIADGNGGADLASVSITVAGRADTGSLL